MSQQLEAVKRGYAYVVMNERGHFFSEGNYDILGPPITDGYDAIQWISTQSWANGKVGLIGCSSTAEWQMAVAAQSPPGLGTIIPQGFGAGVGRVGPYYEQGNWYRGGAVQMLFIAWLYGEQNQVRPMMPPNLTQDERHPVLQVVRPRATAPTRRLEQGASHAPVDGHPQGGRRGRAASSPTRCRALTTGGAMIKRTPERFRLVSRRVVPR
jgi:predicted acyl esterase